MKRKLIAIVMSLICAFSLSACKADKGKNDATTAATTEAATTAATTAGGVMDNAGDAVDDAGDVVEDAGKAVGDAGDDVARGIGDALDGDNYNMSTTNSATGNGTMK